MLYIGLYNIEEKKEKGLKYRSRVDIVAAMLQSAIGGATKTKLMYSAFLSHSQVEEYLEFLRAKRLISFIADKKRYVPTDRGIQFLKMYGEIKDTVTIEGDRKSTRLNSSHSQISYAVFCLKKKKERR